MHAVGGNEKEEYCMINKEKGLKNATYIQGH